MLIVHKKRLLYRLRRNRKEGRSRTLDVCNDQIHRFYLPHAKRTPSPTNKAQNEPAFGQRLSRGDILTVMIRQLKRPYLRSDGQDIPRQMPFLEFGNRAGMNRLRFRRDVLSYECLAFGEDLAQGTNVEIWTGFFEGTPFHTSAPKTISARMKI